MSEWRESRLNTLCEVTSSKRIFSKEYVDTGIPFYRSKEIIEKALGNTITENLFISKNRFSEVQRQFGSPQAGDILISSVGVRSGIPYLVKREDGQFYFKDGNLIWIKSFSELLSSDWLLYWLKSDLGQENLRSTMIGSAQPALTIIGLSQLLLKVPPLPEQKAIARILSSLDDKIELNRRMNETLESMARAIFKDWFVDFGPTRAKQEGRDAYLPEHLWSLFPEAIDLDTGLPQGWEQAKVSKIGQVICGKTPSTKVAEFYGIDVPFITIPDMRGKVFCLDTAKYLSRIGEKSQHKKTLPPGSICVSCIATPGLVVITTLASQTNQQINAVIPTNPQETYYWYWILRDLGEEIRQAGSGGSVLHNLSTERFKNLDVLKPSCTAMTSYCENINSIFGKILENSKESRTLAELRDRLLPKLMSGEIRVKDAEQMVEKVM